jgi:hypothetical protein
MAQARLYPYVTRREMLLAGANNLPIARIMLPCRKIYFINPLAFYAGLITGARMPQAIAFRMIFSPDLWPR